MSPYPSEPIRSPDARSAPDPVDVTSLGVRAPGGRDWRKNGLKMVAIGLGAAAVGLLIGCLFHTT
jgi:hypothetical protein